MSFNASRRNFLRGLAGVSLLGSAGCFSIGKAGGKKIRLAAVGIMGKGFGDWYPMLKQGKAELVALCDADANQFPAAAAWCKRLSDSGEGIRGLDISKIPFYTDYRKMLDDQAKLQIDAMTVSTPDHMHAAIAIRAMKMGIHCYVQKPLVRTLWEAKYFGDTAREYGVITQMGNQGSAGDGFRRNVEILQSGILGDVTEVHVWTNRPVWPQGKLAMLAATTRDIVPVPKGLDWNAWLGVAAGRPYRRDYEKGTPEAQFAQGVYHQFNWRGFLDFGAGAFGDMACHTMNLPFRGLELGAVTDAECTQIEEANAISYPTKSTVRLTYAARESKVRPGVKLPPVTLTWYDGDQQAKGDAKLAALMPQVVAMKQYGGKVPQTGCLVVGTKGILCSCADYGQEAFFALKEDKVAVSTLEHEACKAVPTSIPRRPDLAVGNENAPGAAAMAAEGHYFEFLDAINGTSPVYDQVGSRCYSDVDFSIPIMESILVGTVAQQVAGTRLNWDSAKQLFDVEAANTLVKPVIRRGFEF